MHNLIWLASYPKSGNTWFRSFLEIVLSGSDMKRPDINALSTSTAAMRFRVDDAMELDTSYLTDDEILDAMPEFYAYLSDVQSTPLYLKTHEKYYRLTDGRPNLPEKVTKKAVYFVRNPLEVAVSYAHHNVYSMDRTIFLMQDRQAKLSRQSIGGHQVCQWLGSWSDNVRSWMAISEFPVLVVRYEDMVQDRLNTFDRIVRFLDIHLSERDLSRALDGCSFETLQQLEHENGFREKNPRSASFFRSGRCDSWKEKLSLNQIKQIVHDHGQVMAQLGYSDI